MEYIRSMSILDTQLFFMPKVHGRKMIDKQVDNHQEELT